MAKDSAVWVELGHSTSLEQTMLCLFGMAPQGAVHTHTYTRIHSIACSGT